METTVKFHVNGKPREVTTDPSRPLLDVLREELALTGTKSGCAEGQCGACTVLLEGKRIHSCITPIADVQDKQVLTIEGLAQGERLHPVQEAFLAEAALQCGFCTPGMILSVVALLEEKPAPTDAEINSFLNPQLCRCCGYPNLVKAVRRAATNPRRAS